MPSGIRLTAACAMTVFLCVDSNGSSDVPTGNGVRRIEDDEAKPGLRGTADVTVADDAGPSTGLPRVGVRPRNERMELEHGATIGARVDLQQEPIASFL